MWGDSLSLHVYRMVREYQSRRVLWTHQPNALWCINFIIFLSLDLVTLTNLRINFTKSCSWDTLLGRRQNDSLDKYYCALYEMVVRGSCFCNGQASEMCFNTEEAQWCFQPSRHGELQTHLSKIGFLSSLHYLSAECMWTRYVKSNLKSPLVPGRYHSIWPIRSQGAFGPLDRSSCQILPRWGHHWANGQEFVIYDFQMVHLILSCLLVFLGNGDLMGRNHVIHCLIKMYWRSVHVRAWAQCQSVWVISDAVESRHLSDSLWMTLSWAVQIFSLLGLILKE